MAVTDCDMPRERLWKCLKKAMQERNLCSQCTQPVIPLSYKLIQCSPCIMLYQLYLLLHEYLSSPFQILLSPPNKVFHLVSCLSLHFLVWCGAEKCCGFLNCAHSYLEQDRTTRSYSMTNRFFKSQKAIVKYSNFMIFSTWQNYYHLREVMPWRSFSLHLYNHQLNHRIALTLHAPPPPPKNGW